MLNTSTLFPKAFFIHCGKCIKEVYPRDPCSICLCLVGWCKLEQKHESEPYVQLHNYSKLMLQKASHHKNAECLILLIFEHFDICFSTLGVCTYVSSFGSSRNVFSCYAKYGFSKKFLNNPQKHFQTGLAQRRDKKQKCSLLSYLHLQFLVTQVMMDPF